ncbi:hypothetical protein FQA47_016641 [Oryzias melastigma]|uniref:Uncharacterized protein n=1 Tax=Oryzias melastigma TaxID=30732 RepID=A0A834BRM5_ORYME|nr:hypothetical protein FQA47_016641 [Oryzias melastigma]
MMDLCAPHQASQTLFAALLPFTPSFFADKYKGVVILGLLVATVFPDGEPGHPPVLEGVPTESSVIRTQRYSLPRAACSTDAAPLLDCARLLSPSLPLGLDYLSRGAAVIRSSCHEDGGVLLVQTHQLDAVPEISHSIRLNETQTCTETSMEL